MAPIGTTGTGVLRRVRGSSVARAPECVSGLHMRTASTVIGHFRPRSAGTHVQPPAAPLSRRQVRRLHHERDRSRTKTSGATYFGVSLPRAHIAELGRRCSRSRSTRRCHRAVRIVRFGGLAGWHETGLQPDRASSSQLNSRAKRTYSNTMQFNFVRVRWRCGKHVCRKKRHGMRAGGGDLPNSPEYDLTCRAYVIICSRTR